MIKVKFSLNESLKKATRYFDEIYRIWRSNEDVSNKDSSAYQRAWLSDFIKDTNNFEDELWSVYPDRYGKKNIEEYVLRRFKHNDLIYVYYYNNKEFYDKNKPYEISISENGVQYFINDSKKMRMEVVPSKWLSSSDITKLSLSQEENDNIKRLKANQEKEKEEYYGRGPENIF